MTAVSNATPLIYLGKLTKLHFLKELYGEVIVPTGVWIEIVKPVTEAWVEVPEDLPHIIQAHGDGWLKVKSVETKKGLRVLRELKSVLGPGEGEVIALMMEAKADFALTNDEEAQNTAKGMGIKAKWFTEILLDALNAGLIRDSREYETLLRKAIEKGLWITPDRMSEAVKAAKKLKRSNPGVPTKF